MDHSVRGLRTSKDQGKKHAVFARLNLGTCNLDVRAVGRFKARQTLRQSCPAQTSALLQPYCNETGYLGEGTEAAS